jgi:O-methyltransferase involved in polyketide biosynthesis
MGVPQSARVYDALLDGRDNFAADRAMAKAELAAFPGITQCACANRAFLERTVRYLAARARIRGFLDIGTGFPSANNTHEVAQSIARRSGVVYVDNDPMVLAHARALLTSKGPGKIGYVDADVRDPGMILRQAARLLDFSEPVAVLLHGIMHYIPDEDRPYEIVATLLDAVPPGSYLAMSHQASDLYPEESAELAQVWNERARKTERLTLRGHSQVARFFDGLDLVAPGVVQICKWRPRTKREAGAIAAMWGAVARKP